MRYLLLVCVGMGLMLLGSCGVVKGHSNWFVDKGIKAANSLYVDDNKYEEALEDSIEAITGLKTDLSPASPEVEQ